MMIIFSCAIDFLDVLNCFIRQAEEGGNLSEKACRKFI